MATTTVSRNASTSASAEPGRDGERTRVELPRGTTIGRYVILDRLGEGGMGVVYAAYDPQLDRKLALKLLGSPDGDDARATPRRHRLLREGQAMARLSHPNVITVHDVGTFEAAPLGLGDGSVVFIAMEFIAGVTLAEWIRTRRPWREVVAILAAAGQGLAAAHAAGLVHRDFKPDNVMVGADGRVVVMDFGLARAASDRSENPDAEPARAEEGAAAEDDAERRGPKLSQTVTAAGAILGTPAYMAPEQHEGRGADAKSDQFAFCVALWEGLWGERPFRGDDLTSLAVNVCCGNLREPPAGAAVPTWLRETLRVGLKTDPGARHPSMPALLAELSRRERPRRSARWLLGGLVALAAGAGVYAGLSLDPAARPCRGARDRIADVWNPARRDAVRAALLAGGEAYGPETWRTLEAAVDGYTRDWASAYVEACEATHVRGEQSAVLLDLRMACLGARLGELEALLELLGRGDRGAAARALEAVHGLPRIAACGDAERLVAATPPPDDPGVAGRVEGLRPALARVAALRRAGLVGPGLPAARRLVVEARQVDYPPLSAEALLHLAALERRAGAFALAEQHLRDALAEALRGQADGLAGEAAVELVGVTGREPEGWPQAEAWAQLASALLERAGGDPDAEVSLLVQRAQLLAQGGRLPEAVPLLRRALDRTEHIHGADDARIADLAVRLGDAAATLGDLHEAHRAYARALHVAEHSVGIDHPNCAPILDALGRVELLEGDAALAVARHERALELRRHAFGVDSVECLDSLQGLGTAHAALGHGDQARAHLTAGLELATAHLGEGHPRVATLHLARADAARRAHHFRSAADDDRRALDLIVRAGAAAATEPGWPDATDVRISLGEMLEQLHRHAAAAMAFREALTELEARGEGDGALASRALSGLARVALDQGDRQTAHAAISRLDDEAAAAFREKL